MQLIQNFPFFSIMLIMFTAIICSMLKGKAARYLCMSSVAVVCLLSLATLAYVGNAQVSYVYFMGHFPAPWGNEIRIGVPEAMTATLFSMIVLLILLGGGKYIHDEIDSSKQNYFYLLSSLLLGSLLALIYTNDIFTAYVFLEINTIATCGLIALRHTGRAVSSAIRYMAMSLLGSGLVLIGITLLYTLTGHLLMSNIKEAVAGIVADGTYTIPLTVVIGLITIGLAIKSGLYPFHGWIPDAYSTSAPTSSALLSGLASKGYIILLIKIYYRVLGVNSIVSGKILDVVFVLGIIAMIMGSVHAMHEGDIRRMSAYSSVSHIGYIFMCIGMGTDAGMTAAIFHLYTHAMTKAMLFMSVAGVADVSGLRMATGVVHIKHPEALFRFLQEKMGRSEKMKGSYGKRRGHKERKEVISEYDIRQQNQKAIVAEAGEELVGVTGVFDSTVHVVRNHPDLLLRKPSADSNRFDDTKGAGHRNRIAGFAYCIGALSIVGVPLLAGFSSKLNIATSVLGVRDKLWPVMITMAISTILMVVYFLRMLIQLYLPSEKEDMRKVTWKQQKGFAVSLGLFVVLNVFFGLCSGWVISLLEQGMKLFG